MENPKSKAAYEQWKIMSNWINNNLKVLSDDDLKRELAPDKNHGVWVLGHLMQSEDELSTFLGKGKILFPEYEQMFGQGTKLLPFDAYPPVETLRRHWKEVLTKNDKILSEMTDGEWEEKHCVESGADDFFKTKGRCIMIWNLHQMYHNGQLAILLAIAGKSRY